VGVNVAVASFTRLRRWTVRFRVFCSRLLLFALFFPVMFPHRPHYPDRNILSHHPSLVLDASRWLSATSPSVLLVENGQLVAGLDRLLFPVRHAFTILTFAAPYLLVHATISLPTNYLHTTTLFPTPLHHLGLCVAQCVCLVPCVLLFFWV